MLVSYFRCLYSVFDFLALRVDHGLYSGVSVWISYSVLGFFSLYDYLIPSPSHSISCALDVISCLCFCDYDYKREVWVLSVFCRPSRVCITVALSVYYLPPFPPLPYLPSPSLLIRFDSLSPVGSGLRPRPLIYTFSFIRLHLQLFSSQPSRRVDSLGCTCACQRCQVLKITLQFNRRTHASVSVFAAEGKER